METPKFEPLKSWALAVLLLAGILLLAQLLTSAMNSNPLLNPRKDQQVIEVNTENLDQSVRPVNGVTLPVRWSDLGRKLIESGVIDKTKLAILYDQRGGLNEESRRLLYETDNGRLEINEKNASFLLNLLWALGLANQNPILEEGPMVSPVYGSDAGQFASTGGWPLSKGKAMDHYSRHSLLPLNSEQQKLVEKAAKNIYRPCCGNSTHFPDCNHGMAMLGLLELGASQGLNEDELYQMALQVNSYWFPDTYLIIASYFHQKGIAWNEVNPKEVLGSAYSSAQGYRQILSAVEPEKIGGSGSCGV